MLAAILTGHVHTSLSARFAGTALPGAGGVAVTGAIPLLSRRA